MEKGEAFTPEDPQIVSLGLSGQGFAQLMRGAGFRPAVSQGPSDANWAFGGRPRRVDKKPTSHGARHFAGLADLLGQGSDERRGGQECVSTCRYRWSRET